MSAVCRILVVDDNPATLYSTSRVLRGAGFEVIEAGTGREALAKADLSIDLLLLDINLPDMTGFEVCRELRARPDTTRMPILHISATLTTDFDIARGLTGGADGYLTQPLEPVILLATVNALLRARRAEDEMRRSEAKFRAIFNDAPSGIAMLTGDGIIEEVNPMMCHLLNAERDEIIGRNLMDFVSSEHRERASTMQRDLQTKLKFRGNFPLSRENGSAVEIGWNISLDPATGLQLAIATDITQEKKSEKERDRLLTSERTARSEAERANRVKDDFLATLSHELRNPLNAIIGWTTVLKGMQPTAEILRGVETIERNAKIQAQLVSDLLDVSRISAGKLLLEVELIDLADVVKSALDAVMPAAHAKEIELRQTLSGGGARVRGDTARLQQVIWNLLSNAVRFTPKGGKVEIDLKTVESNVELSITDNGRGIRKEFVPHVFERFRQEDSSASKLFGGLGLGLSIVKHLTEMHGGEVRVSSEGENKGATFTISVPVASASENESLVKRTARLPARAGRSVNLEGIRVLLVEDDNDTRTVVAFLLRDVKADVVESASVDDALSRLTESRPDLLISDIGMPVKDGYDLIRQVRRLGHSAARLPAIALTAFARPEDRREALLAGYQMHLSKPIDPQELRAAAASLVGRTGSMEDAHSA